MYVAEHRGPPRPASPNCTAIPVGHKGQWFSPVRSFSPDEDDYIIPNRAVKLIHYSFSASHTIGPRAPQDGKPRTLRGRLRSFGVRQLAAAFSPASLLAAPLSSLLPEGNRHICEIPRASSRSRVSTFVGRSISEFLCPLPQEGEGNKFTRTGDDHRNHPRPRRFRSLVSKM